MNKQTKKEKQCWKCILDIDENEKLLEYEEAEKFEEVFQDDDGDENYDVKYFEQTL